MITARGGSSISPPQRPPAGERHERGRRVEPLEACIAAGELAPVLVPGTGEGEDDEPAEEGHVARVGVHDHVGERPQADAHEHRVAGDPLHAGRLVAGGAGDRGRAGGHDAGHEQHEAGQVREQEEEIDRAGGGRRPEQRSRVAVRHVVVHQRREEDEGDERIGAEKPFFPQPRDQPGSDRPARRQHVARGEEQPEDDDGGGGVVHWILPMCLIPDRAAAARA